MDENYDEFGNYIGPDMPEINDEDDEEPQNTNQKVTSQDFKNISSEEDDDDLDDEKTEKNPNVPITKIPAGRPSRASVRIVFLRRRMPSVVYTSTMVSLPEIFSIPDTTSETTNTCK